MKFSKIASVAAAIAAAGMMTISAGANSIIPVSSPASKQVTGINAAAYHAVLYYDGNGTSADSNKPVGAIDGLDLSKIAKLSVTVSVPEEEQGFFTGNIGGGLILGINGGDLGTGDNKGDKYDDYNWVQKGWWGVNDEDLELVSGDGQDAAFEKIGDYTYQLTADFENPLANGDASEIGQVQIQFAEWGSDMAQIRVEKLEALDASGNALITFDAAGDYTLGGGSSSTPAPDNTDNTGDTTPSTPNNVDTGVEGVAAVVGVAALAAGAVVLSRKRK